MLPSLNGAQGSGAERQLHVYNTMLDEPQQTNDALRRLYNFATRRYDLFNLGGPIIIRVHSIFLARYANGLAGERGINEAVCLLFRGLRHFEQLSKSSSISRPDEDSSLLL